MPQLQDFVWTWNIFITVVLTIVVLPIAAKLIVRAIIKHLEVQSVERDKKDEEIKKLLAEKELEKEVHIKARWDTHTKTQCEIKKNLDTIGKALLTKLDKEEHEEDCENHMKLIWERLDHHCHDSNGNVVIPAGRHT